MPTRCLFLFAALVAAPPLAHGQGVVPENNAPKQRGDVGFDENIGVQLPLDLAFRDESEKPITLRQCINGKPTVLVMAYYRCQVLCSEVLNGLVDSMRGMPADYTAGNQFNVVTVSFDHKEHGELATRKKQSYIDRYGRAGAENGWRFLTATEPAVKELTETIGFKYEFDKVFKEYNHPSGIVVLSPEGKVMRYFYGIRYDLNYDKVGGGSTTLRLSLIEAADGQGGSLLDRLTMLCSSFDRSDKRYSLSVRKLMRLAGVVTMLAVALGVGVALLRDRRRKPPLPTLADPRPAPETPAAGPTEGTK